MRRLQRRMLFQGANMRYYLLLVLAFSSSLSFDVEAVENYQCSGITGCGSTWWDSPSAAGDALCQLYIDTGAFTCSVSSCSPPGTGAGATCDIVQTRLSNGTVTNITNSLGFREFCVSPQIWDNVTQVCIDPPPPDCLPPRINDPDSGTCICPGGQTYSLAFDLCFTPPDCSLTVGNSYDGNFVSTPAAVVECHSGCAYQPTTFNSSDGVSGFWTYNATGAACNGTAPDGTNPIPEPTPPDPITPTTPDAPVQDDGNTTPDPATDENQEQMSQQLQGIQTQLQNLEQGSANQTLGTTNTNSLLTQLLNETKAGNGKGKGTGDGDGNGTDDFFADGGCLSSPACDGPAIECAIANQAYLTRCNLQDDTQDITEVDVMASVGQSQTLEQYFDPAKPGNTVDVSEMFIAPAESISSCPGDYAITTRYGNFSLSYSSLCTFGTMVRPVVLLSAWIIVGLMFYSSLLRDW